MRLERVPNMAELVADLAPEEEKGNDRHDGNEPQDECVFREALPVLIEPRQGLVHEGRELCEHGDGHLPLGLTTPGVGRQRIPATGAPGMTGQRAL